MQYLLKTTDIDLSKILSWQTKILGEKVVKSDKCMDDSQLLRARALAAPLSLCLCLRLTVHKICSRCFPTETLEIGLKGPSIYYGEGVSMHGEGVGVAK